MRQNVMGLAGLMLVACGARQSVPPSSRVCEAAGSELVYVANPSYVSAIPFGAGQFQNGDTGKGVGFAIAEAATGATSVGIFSYLASTYGLRANVSLEDAQEVRSLQQIQVISGVLFFGLYALGVADAIVHHRRFVPQCKSTVAAR